MTEKYVTIDSYQDLYDQVKDIKSQYNFHMDTSELVDTLIYKWFSKGGVNALDSCYQKFNKKLEECNLCLKIQDGEIELEEN